MPHTQINHRRSFNARPSRPAGLMAAQIHNGEMIDLIDFFERDAPVIVDDYDRDDLSAFDRQSFLRSCMAS